MSQDKVDSKPSVELPQETVERWIAIVKDTIASGRDISGLVQQYAEQSFASRVSYLEAQGVQRRMLGNALLALQKEQLRAQNHLEKEPKHEKEILLRPYLPVFIHLPDIKDLKISADRRKDPPWEHQTKAPEDPMRRRKQLEDHLNYLHALITSTELDTKRIDSILARGLKNKDSVIQEISGITKELYRIAQQVLEETKTQKGQDKAVDKHKPESHPDKATGKKQAQASDKAPKNPGESTSDAEKNPNKTVPINPIPLGLAKLQTLLKQVTSPLFGIKLHLPDPRKQVEPLQKVVHPIYQNSVEKLQAATHRSQAAGQSFLQKLGAMRARLIQYIKDIWPWRAPPPS